MQDRRFYFIVHLQEDILFLWQIRGIGIIRY